MVLVLLGTTADTHLLLMLPRLFATPLVRHPGDPSANCPAAGRLHSSGETSMKKVCAILLCAIAGGAILASGQSAHAIAPFKKQFDAMYVKPGSSDPAEKKLAEAAEAAKCNICHMGEKKKDRNSYGQALAKLLKKTDKDDVDKIKGALETVAKEHSDASNPSSPTFGDLIKQGKLPGGN
jgi:hypothetical protein